MNLLCFNYDCDRELSDYEISRLNPVKFSKHRLCKKCRQRQHMITRIRCDQCSGPFKQDTPNKTHCNTCKKQRIKFNDRHMGIGGLPSLARNVNIEGENSHNPKFTTIQFKRIRDSLFRSWVMMGELH